MGNPKLAKILLFLADKTSAGTITWEETARPGVFQTSLSDYTIQLSQWENEVLPEDPDYMIQVRNTDGQIIDEARDEQLKEDMQEPFKIMHALYESARRVAMGVEQALDDIISGLQDKSL